MVDSAKQTYTVDLDDAFVEALKAHAHERLGVTGGNTLLGSLHVARLIQRAMSRTEQPSDATREVEAALQNWSRAFSEAARYLEHGKPDEKNAAIASALEALDHTDAAYHAAKTGGILKPVLPSGGIIHYKPTEEDILLAAAAHQDAADILYRMEYEGAYPAEAD